LGTVNRPEVLRLRRAALLSNRFAEFQFLQPLLKLIQP
jgi:hypothetical protein